MLERGNSERTLSSCKRISDFYGCAREARRDGSASRDHGLQRRRRAIRAPTEGHLTARLDLFLGAFHVVRGCGPRFDGLGVTSARWYRRTLPWRCKREGRAKSAAPLNLC